MATDSSSGTLPSSSRLTITSSASIARSKLSFLTSPEFLTSPIMLSAILSSCVHAPPGATENIIAGGSWRVEALKNKKSGAGQRGDMRRDRFLQALQIIAAFEHRNNS